MLKISIKGSPKSFQSVALENALRNFGQLPLLMGKIGSAVTQEIKRNLDGRILQRRTSKLFNSWDWRVVAFGNRGWRTEIGSDVIYARIHQFGGFAGPNHSAYIPARNYVSLAVDKQLQLIKKLTKDFITRIFYA